MRISRCSDAIDLIKAPVSSKAPNLAPNETEMGADDDIKELKPCAEGKSERAEQFAAWSAVVEIIAFRACDLASQKAVATIVIPWLAEAQRRSIGHLCLHDEQK